MCGPRETLSRSASALDDLKRPWRDRGRHFEFSLSYGPGSMKRAVSEHRTVTKPRQILYAETGGTADRGGLSGIRAQHERAPVAVVVGLGQPQARIVHSVHGRLRKLCEVRLVEQPPPRAG